MANPRTYGFLLFHNRVVGYFQAIVNSALQNPVSPFTEPELAAMNVSPFGDDPDQADSLEGLATFSRRFESWHNPTHRVIGAATGTPLTDPRQNIFYRPFWQLHLYIDDLFGRALGAYAGQAHPGQLLSEDMIASHLESTHHGWVPRI